jgi:Tol biopolymer transport system component
MSSYMRSALRLLIAAFACAAVLPAGTAFAQADSNRTTFLLSRAYDGGLPNGVSRNAAVSHDQRVASHIAFESDATNIVPGDTNGLTDVFVVHRAGPWGHNGTPWRIGSTDLVSHGLGGQPANGRSYRPVIDGASHDVPSCVAFVSDASNLVPGDTNGKSDAFVYNLNSKTIVRVSTDSHGRQSNGSTYEVSVDGDCERVAFVSDATNLALKSTRTRAWRTARTSAAPAGTKQVYVKILRGEGYDRGFRGLTFLASASNNGRAANGNSWHVAFARAGKALVFASDASNLSGGDHNGVTDIYERGFVRHYVHFKGKGGGQVLQFETKLVSANSSGVAGNGASTNPTVTDNGQYVAFESLASNLAGGDTNGVSDVFEAKMAGRHPKQTIVSRSHFSGLGNGASNHPVVSDAGEFVLFDSLANNLRPSGSVSTDDNGVRDVFLWNRPTGNVSLESRNSVNGYLDSPSQHPAPSARGNYVPFESANPQIDAVSARTSAMNDPVQVPDLIDPDVIAPTVPTVYVPGQAGPDPALAQVYVRYLGPQ